MAELRIGSSGWHYAHWRGVFYPADLRPQQMLAFYARHFDTVEVNNTFYRLPAVSTVRAWHDKTPPGFCFAVKASRYITHMKKLKQPHAGLARMTPVLKALKEKRGPVLFQLPPRWKKNTELLAQFLAALPEDLSCAFEFRDPSWHHPEVYAALNGHNAAFCIFDLAGFCAPLEISADFAYVRLHGPDGAYAGCYSKRALRGWAERIRGWSHLKQVYVYFDNDQAAYAVRNALELKELLA